MRFTAEFAPRFGVDFKSTVNVCLEISSLRDCGRGPHGPIGDWDVTRVRSLYSTFSGTAEFNANISKWDVSSVTGIDSFSKVKSNSTVISENGTCHAFAP